MAQTPQGSYRTGLMVGFERGMLDRMSCQRQETSKLWVPEGVGVEYCRGLTTGYLKGVTGETLVAEWRRLLEGQGYYRTD